MDLSNRNTQPQPVAPAPHTAAAPGGPSAGRKESRRRGDKSKWSRVVYVAIVAAIALIIGAVAIIAGSSNKPESEYVNTGKLQAVFLNTGQVYFGHVKSLNDKYFRVTDIYYLQASNNGSSSSSTSANSNVTLVKLGCELHEPYDQMIINSDQVTFWENLQDNGQVAKAVATFEKQNPQGQKCADQSSSASTNSSSSTQNANTNSSSNSSTTGSGTTGTTPSTGTGSTNP
ncbi:MAG TPA: hypothetical protein VN554_02595 [Verrucomicrobiae bacterium]|nr:hypothetical protein [Verrucomicrobiae bacterium]